MTTTIGNPTDAVELLSPELTADPFGEYAKLREQAPILTGTLMGGPPMWLVSRYADVRRLLTDPRFVNNPASVPGAAPRDRFTIMKKLNIPTDLVDYLADKIFEIDGADHRRLRKLASRAFTARRVAQLRPRIEEITTTLLDRMAEAGRDGAPVDLMEAFSYPLPITVICELIGIDEDDRPQWHDWGSVLSTPMAHVERLPTVFRDSIGQLLDVIARRRADPRDDLISAFIQAQEDDGDRLSDREMVSLVFTMVIAGHETTTYLLGNSVLALLENQDQLALLRKDPSRWPQAVNELMRLGPAQFGQPRYPVEDVELGGVTIPKGEPIIPLLLSANTDPRKYEAPRRLDIGRDTGHAHLGFGQGAHYCLGAPLALLEAEVALNALFTRFPDLSLAVARDQIPWTLRPGFTRAERIPLKLG
ncbi:cytochrome P450 [Streptomyces sp. NPDC048304]|uniref:cytochrome P450 family protein n=1 Tax=Streptomyces sp. NPDC048304 TaxID=3154820 RepID=UPI0033C21B1E